MKTIIQNNNPALVLVTAWPSQKDGKAIIRVQSESILAYEIVEMACKGTTEFTVNPITIHGTSRAYEALTVILVLSQHCYVGSPSLYDEFIHQNNGIGNWQKSSLYD